MPAAQGGAIICLLYSSLTTTSTQVQQLKKLQQCTCDQVGCETAMRAIRNQKNNTLATNFHKKVVHLCKNHNPSAVEESFAAITHCCSQRDITALCVARTRAGLLEAAHDAVSQFHVPPKPIACLAALVCCCQRGRPDLATSIWCTFCQRFQVAEFDDAHIFQESVSALEEVGEWDTARLVDTWSARVATQGTRDSLTDSGLLPLERTLVLLKPGTDDPGLASYVYACLQDAGLKIVRKKKWKMREGEAESFLRVSWGSTAGSMKRRFFRELVEYYTSGPVTALLVEGPGAISAWRHILGPGDPWVARGEHPDSVRARFGVSKLRNAAHGADSPASARREIAHLFTDEDFDVGEDLNEVKL